jgi:hypothetical protein
MDEYDELCATYGGLLFHQKVKREVVVDLGPFWRSTRHVQMGDCWRSWNSNEAARKDQ